LISIDENFSRHATLSTLHRSTSFDFFNTTQPNKKPNNFQKNASMQSRLSFEWQLVIPAKQPQHSIYDKTDKSDKT
jgi:hypothetical protein